MRRSTFLCAIPLALALVIVRKVGGPAPQVPPRIRKRGVPPRPAPQAPPRIWKP